ncbi:MAG TPA: GtrA family protein [Solirubrobacteraceae bacterium]
MAAPSLAGQGMRFAASGGVVALVYIAATTLLAEVIGIPFEVALAIGFSLAIATHFALQRVFVWAHADGFALPMRRQALRYLPMAGLQYGLTAAATAVLPAALGVPTEVVYLCAAGVLSAVNFFVFRARVFHPAGGS